MQCPYCGHPDSRVVDSRLAAGGTVTWRRRECEACKRRFTTYERVEQVLPLVKKKDGAREPYDREKLHRSLRIACSKRPVSPERLEEEVEAVERALALTGEKEVPSRFIGECVMERLRTLDQVAYVRFASVYREFRDLGEFLQEMGRLTATGADAPPVEAAPAVAGPAEEVGKDEPAAAARGKLADVSDDSATPALVTPPVEPAGGVL